MRPTILHVVPSLSRGGGGRSALAACGPFDRLLSLSDADPFMLDAATRAGVDVRVAPSPAEVAEHVERTDVLQLHFWNTPDVYGFLGADLPPARTMLRCHVLGDSAPQVLTREAVAWAGTLVTVHPRTATLAPNTATVATIPSLPSFDRLQDVRPTAHADYTVGYIGTVDPIKMHPDFATLCERVDVPGARFVVCGGGRGWDDLIRERASGSLGARLDLRGYVEDIGSVLGELDVFGYPLAPGNYSATDLVLMEAMYAGVPPVVLPYGGTADMIDHLRNGIVAEDEDDYVRWIERLHERPDLRQELGTEAARHARRTWNPDQIELQWARVHAQVAGRERRAREPVIAPPFPGAGVGARTFLMSLGDHGSDFSASLAGTDLRATLEAEQRIAGASPVLASPDAGGVLHWRLAHPDDGHLRYWAGLVLLGQGSHALAFAELTAAVRLGCDHWRVAWHLAASARLVGLVDPPAGTPAPLDLPEWARPLLQLR